jgi:hypothetical protein
MCAFVTNYRSLAFESNCFGWSCGYPHLWQVILRWSRHHSQYIYALFNNASNGFGTHSIGLQNDWTETNVEGSGGILISDCTPLFTYSDGRHPRNMRFRVLDCGSGFEPETFQIRNQKYIHSPRLYPYESVSLEFRAPTNIILCHVTDRQKR